MYGDLSEIQITRFSKAYKLKGKYKPKLGFSEERGAGKGGVQEGGGGGEGAGGFQTQKLR